jgi:hypothetical protein
MSHRVQIGNKFYIEHDLKCADCQRAMVLTPFKAIVLYRCVGCSATHSANPDGTPSGFPGNKALRTLRRKVLRTLQAIPISDTAKEHWMQGVMGPESGVSRFNEDQCKQILTYIYEDFKVAPVKELGEGQTGFFELQ